MLRKKKKKVNLQVSVTRNKARVRIRKKEMFVFRKTLRALFSCNARFEICLFAGLPT